MQVLRAWTLPTNAKHAPLKDLRQAAITNTPFNIDNKSTGNVKPFAQNAHQQEPCLTHLAVSDGPTSRVLAFAASDRRAYIFDFHEDQAVAQLDIGAEGASHVVWSRNGQAVLAWSNSHLRLSVYDLARPSPTVHIANPKSTYPAGKMQRTKPEHARQLLTLASTGVSFNADGSLMAVLERHNSRDSVGIYDCAQWSLLKHFLLPSPTVDASDVHWSPCGRFLAINEAVTDYVAHIYTPDGRHLSTFEPYASLGRAPATAESMMEVARRDRSTQGWVGLGTRVLKWQTTGEWLALGGYDGKIRILSRQGWLPVAELNCPTRIMSQTVVWREPAEWTERTRGKGIIPFDAVTVPYSLIATRPDVTKPNPKLGISQLAWSPSGCWLAALNQTYPSIVWIFSLLSSQNHQFRPHLHSALVHNCSISSFVWQPMASNGSGEGFEEEEDDVQETLTIASGERGFTVWREPNPDDEVERVGMAECVGVPSQTEFGPTNLQFSRTGKALLLADKQTFAVAYPVIK
ncbi:hypothetical protein OIV83_004083 [Microbotryomycetes sp. JL201]|nr:hypothetical protein OIV83_004083 [Microbotryomycetes sp. JL201]